MTSIFQENLQTFLLPDKPLLLPLQLKPDLSESVPIGSCFRLKCDISGKELIVFIFSDKCA